MTAELIVAAYYAVPFLVVALLAVGAVVYAGATIARPTLLVYPYLCVLFWFGSTNFGRLDGASAAIYSRGSGLLYFSLLLWLTLASWVWAKTSAMLVGWRPHKCGLYPWFVGWTVLLMAHVVYGALTGVDIRSVLLPGGFSNIIWMTVLIGLVLTAFRSEAQVETLTKFVLLTACGSAIFGLTRWIAFGGDPANAYANLHGLQLKLTYFEINESLLCCLGFVIAMMRLYTPTKQEGGWWRAVYMLTVIATVACIVLSFRRTAWLGLGLAALIVIWRLPPGRRVSFVLLTAGGLLPLVAYAALKRLAQTKGAGDLAHFFYDLAPQAFGAEGARLLELKFALYDFLQYPLFGLGAWGRYSGSQLISWQMQEGGGFVHSGVLHIALKTGLVGLLLFAGIVLAFSIFSARAVKRMCPRSAALGVAGIAGAAFMIPDMIIGTPIPQVRTMQMIAFCLSLPYLAYGVSSVRADVKSATTLGAKGARPALAFA